MAKKSGESLPDLDALKQSILIGLATEPQHDSPDAVAEYWRRADHIRAQFVNDQGPTHNMWTDAAREASAAARHASIKANKAGIGKEVSNSHADKAVDAKNSKEAIKHHEAAAKLHDVAARTFADGEGHEDAVAAHREAAAMHRKAIVAHGGKRTDNEWTEAAREASAESRRKGGGASEKFKNAAARVAVGLHNIYMAAGAWGPDIVMGLHAFHRVFDHLSGEGMAEPHDFEHAGHAVVHVVEAAHKLIGHAIGTHNADKEPMDEATFKKICAEVHEMLVDIGGDKAPSLQEVEEHYKTIVKMR